MRTMSIPGIQCKIKKCPICGKNLVLVDTINYFTLICKKCHTTVFEEFDGTLHKIKQRKMKDGYDASLDIFIKSLMSDTMNTCKMSPDKKKEYYMEKLFEGEILDYGIYQPDIFNFFTCEMERNKQELKSPCIYFEGYEKYYDRILEFQDEIKEWQTEALEVIRNQ